MPASDRRQLSPDCAADPFDTWHSRGAKVAYARWVSDQRQCSEAMIWPAAREVTG